MGWSIPLQTASYKGVSFDIFSVSESNDKALVEHNYPYVDGADIEDMGLNAHSVQMSAVYFGKGFNLKARQLLEVLAQTGAGVLMHPIYGRMQDMAVVSYSLSHSAEEIDYVSIDLSFKKATAGKPVFAADFGEIAQIDKLFNQLQHSIDAINYQIQLLFNQSDYAQLALSVINNVMANVYDVLGLFDGNNRNQTQHGQTPINKTVTGLVTDSIKTIYTQQNQLASPVFSRLNRTHKVLLDTVDLQFKLLDPKTKRKLKEVLPVMRFAIASTSVHEVCIGFGEMLENNHQADTINPVILASDNRFIRQTLAQQINAINNRFDDYQTQYELVSHQCQIAHDINQLVAQLINQKPPLIVKVVEQDSNLIQLAHHYYSDFSRHTELLRLNPHIKHPCFISQQGALINAFAR